MSTRRAAIIVATCVLVAVAPAAMAGQVHAATTTLEGSSATGWDDAQAALEAPGSASTPFGDRTLTVSGFGPAATGTVQVVRLRVDVSQDDHRDDRLEVSATAEGCSSVSATPSSIEPVATRRTFDVTLSCSGGWTWDRIASLSVSLRSDARGGMLLLSGSDGDWHAHHARLSIEYENAGPDAEAGDDHVVAEGTEVALSAAASSDAEDEALSFAWRQVDGPPVALSDPSSVTASFTAPWLSNNNDVVLGFEVTVTDASGHADSDGVQVTVHNVNQAPQAVAGPDLAVAVGDAVSLSAAASSDPDGDPLRFRWRQVAGPAVALQGSGAETASFTPSATGTYVFDVAVEDPAGLADSDRIAVAASLPTTAAGAPPDASAGGAPDASDQGPPPDEGNAPSDPSGPGDAGAAVEDAVAADGATCQAVIDADGPGRVVFPAQCGVSAVSFDAAVAAPGSRIVAHRSNGWPGGTAPDADLLTDPVSIRLEDADGRLLPARLVVDHPMPADTCDDCTLMLYRSDGTTWQGRSLDGDAQDLATELQSGEWIALASVAPTPTGDGWPLPLVPAALAALGLIGLVVAGRRRQRSRVAEPDTRPRLVLGDPDAASKNAELLEFLNTASHDLAGPLTPIRLQLDLLHEIHGDIMTDGQKRALAVVERNVDHMGILVTDLRDAARLQAGHLEVYPEAMDLTGLVQDACESFAPACDEKDVRLVCDANEPVAIDGDRSRLTQVLYNLINNALKFTDDGTIHVALRAMDDGRVTVVVRDSGIGMTQEDAAKLFRPFSQAHQAAQKKKGSGLGLFICKGIVEGHGGEIWCESDGPGQGSIFAFTLPVRQERVDDAALVAA